MQSLLDALPLPRRASRAAFVHVAGSNGKCGVAVKVAAALQVSRAPPTASWRRARSHALVSPQAGGYRTGLFVSPHIACFRERICVDGVPISEGAAAAAAAAVFAAADARALPCTFFELVTAMALRHFDDAGVDAAVLEAGLGGRLDATNVVRPAVSVITSIGARRGGRAAVASRGPPRRLPSRGPAASRPQAWSMPRSWGTTSTRLRTRRRA